MTTISNRQSCELCTQVHKSFSQAVPIPSYRLSRRWQVEQANSARLNALPGDLMTFYANDIPGYDMHKNPIKPDRASKMLDETLAPRQLKLRVGAQVMLTKVLKHLN
jgi:hypothetical protein